MLRRTLTAAFALAALAASSIAHALEIRPYDAALLARLQGDGQPVAVHFHASWCPTCVNQSRALGQLQAAGQLPGLTVLVADYDREKDLRRTMNVRSQSTLVVFRGSVEKTRVGGETDPAKLRAALRTAL